MLLFGVRIDAEVYCWTYHPGTSCIRTGCQRSSSLVRTEWLCSCRLGSSCHLDTLRIRRLRAPPKTTGPHRLRRNANKLRSRPGCSCQQHKSFQSLNLPDRNTLLDIPCNRFRSSSQIANCTSRPGTTNIPTPPQERKSPADNVSVRPPGPGTSTLPGTPRIQP